MKELIEILDAIDRHAREGQQMALATIVGVRGSTYRREGARLLCTERQQMIGNISGGCLESDIMVVAEDVMATGRPRMVTYDLTADDDMVWGLRCCATPSSTRNPSVWSRSWRALVPPAPGWRSTPTGRASAR
ncbi:MAG: XdhC family protein [Armatimonadetes bacterium]|nr:XdhC family protein [Armatimonadota bacterium]